MRSKLIKIFSVTMLLALLIVPVSAQMPQTASPELQTAFDAGSLSSGAAIVDDSSQTDSAAKASHRLIVQLESAPVSVWASESAVEALDSGGKINFAAPSVQAYTQQLQAEQAAFVTNMQAALPDASVSQYINEFGARVDLTYQVAFNGVTVDPGSTPREQARKALAALPGVKAVYLDYARDPQLYASLPLINATAAWDNAAIGGKANAGAGVKVASMDGGLHHEAPMFDGTGFSYPADYPPGGLGLTANNNGKIIASRVYFRAWDPPSAGDENPWPGTQGTSHGTHTGSTAAGNEVVADYLGITETISGVAPAAWVMSYRVFYNSITNDGSFYNAEGIAALEDILMDGADALNNSWGGGPGSVGGEFDPLDQALINVANAGTFVSMSAGNAGPANGTTDHPSDEYISVAASTTDGTLASGRLSVSAPEPVPSDLLEMPYSSAAFGGTFPPGSINTFDFLPAAAVDPANFEGCNPWPADTFTGKAALISRGACEFGVKVLNAEQAGADFVIVHNHAAGGDELINMAAGAVGNLVTIPSVFIGNTNGLAMVDWYNTNGSASQVTLDTFAFQAGNIPDVLASFSSRGPGVGNVLKPDITAPGINILAQGYTPGATGEDRHLGFGQASGTSMAAPHVTGAAALLRQIHPDWPNAAIKSALMSTSKYIGIWNHDGSHAQPLDMGAGRLDLTNAADPGVILDEPSVGFGQMVTGTMQSMHVMVTSVAGDAETYDLSTISVGGAYPTATVGTLPGFTVDPVSVTLEAGATAMITVTFDSTMGVIGDNQGFVVMDGEMYDAHLPVWARVAPPAAGDVLLIDVDANEGGFPEYLGYYTDVLDNLGLTYDVLNWAFEDVWDAASLSAYDMIVLFTGDNYFYQMSDQDMDRLTEFANNGGVIFAMGQDLASAMNSAVYDDGSFLYNSVLGGNYLQDSVTGYYTPTLPVEASSHAPLALQGVQIDLGDTGDGAANQFYIDEIETLPWLEPDDPGYAYPYMALLRYPGPYNLAEGTVAMAHRAQPSLENPGVAYFGRSIYTTFGLEGVNNGMGIISREDLLSAFMDWAMDEPTVTISDTTPTNGSAATFFTADLTSNITGTVGVEYRWDYGDGSEYAGPYASNQTFHQYAECGTYTVRVEAKDSWGNVVIGDYETEVINCTALPTVYLPQVFNNYPTANVRVAHASPDAPAVDVLVNDGAAFTNLAFSEVTDYANLLAGTYNVKVVPTGATTPVVIEADLPLTAGVDYTVAAVNTLDSIEAVVFVDDNSTPAAGKAHVRFIHLSPDAPAVDVAVTSGPVLFSDVAFKEASSYLPVDAGTYDLEVRLTGTTTVALAVPGVTLEAGKVYTVFAEGLAAGTPALQAVLTVDN